MTHGTVLITGANRGIGLEFATQYANEKWKVLACCRQPEEAKALHVLSKTHPLVSILRLNVCDQDQISRLAADLSSTPLDLLINNAGVPGMPGNDWGSGSEIKNVAADSMLHAFSTNAIAPLQMARAFVGHLEQGNLKTIASISSQMGSIGLCEGGSYAYRMSKAALNMGMKCLAREWAPKQIRVLLLHPGWVKTDMGGPQAPVEKQDSVKGLRAVIADKSHNGEGQFFDYRGRELPW
jgi:NAD(P)-dependent dehydrogenase (short-subunit alcohol dehydrogenase family)